MMERSKKRGRLVTGVAALCLLSALAFTGSKTFSASVDLSDFDYQGKKIYDTFDATPQMYMSADS